MKEFEKLIKKLRKDENITGIYVLLESWMKDYEKYHGSFEYGALKGAVYGLYGAGYIGKKDTDKILNYLNVIMQDYLTSLTNKE